MIEVVNGKLLVLVIIKISNSMNESREANMNESREANSFSAFSVQFCKM